MSDAQRTVMGHYNITNPYPTQWPADLDQSDDEDLPVVGSGGGVRRSRSRYSALERSAGDRRTLIPGSQRTGDGRQNLVQKDEADPLGGVSSVIQSLRQRGLPVEEDIRLRNKFLLSSTTFSPALFLSQTHPNATTDELLRGLEYLSHSIDQKSASLKVLVESNFERFVRAKATIDNVYTEMRNQGIEPEPHISPRQSRHANRLSGQFRSFSGSTAGLVATPPTQQFSKNALRKESEYGVQGIKAPLLEVSQKAEDVWGPALGGRERESSLKSVAEAVEKNKPLYEIGTNLSRYIKQKDYTSIVQQYGLARTCFNKVKSPSDHALSGRQPLTDEQIHTVLVTGRMWMDVEEQIKALKRDIWRRLSSSHASLTLSGARQAEEHMELIGVLLELGVEDNPIWVWLLSRYDHLKTKITAVIDRSKVEIEILRRRLAASEKPGAQTTASYIRQVARESSLPADTEQVVEFWEAVVTYMTKLLSLSSGLLGEVVDFWDSTQSFIDGDKQKSLPGGFDGQSRKHHRLSESGVRDLQNGAIDLVNIIREAVLSLFTDPPVEDVSSLFSPSSATTPKTPISAVFSPTDGRLGKIDAQNVPPASPKIGEAWEDFAFWPPYSNSVSAGHYLSRVLVLVGTAAGEMVAIRPVASSPPTFEKIKAMVGGTRDRCMRAICDAWGKDAECCKHLEDWSRSIERRDLTNMSARIMAFEKSILLGLQQVLYSPEEITKTGARDIVTPPPPKLIEMAKTQFVSSIFKILSGMVENAEKPLQVEEDEWVLVTSAMAHATLDEAPDQENLVPDTINASRRNVRMLLTLSNLKDLRTDLVPQLIALFESSFSIKLINETKTIRDVFGQIDAKLFHSYTRPTVAILVKTIKDGINSPDWVPTTNRPDQVKPYVYATMMTLVGVHTEVSTTLSNPSVVSSSGTSSSPPALLNETISYLLENISQALLDAFKDRKPPNYSLPALMQATLDTEFIAQTMSQYATNKASETQSQIYTELDKRTNHESRAQLQQELSEMKGVLKKLRDGSRSSFGCFKRARGAEKEGSRGRPERKATG